MINVIEKTNDGAGFVAIRATCGKFDAEVYRLSDNGSVFVSVRNSSNRAHRGPGRGFDSVEKAVSGYKSSDVKSIIRQFAEEFGLESA